MRGRRHIVFTVSLLALMVFLVGQLVYRGHWLLYVCFVVAGIGFVIDAVLVVRWSVRNARVGREVPPGGHCWARKFHARVAQAGQTDSRVDPHRIGTRVLSPVTRSVQRRMSGRPRTPACTAWARISRSAGHHGARRTERVVIMRHPTTAAEHYLHRRPPSDCACAGHGLGGPAAAADLGHRGDLPGRDSRVRARHARGGD